SVPPRSSAGCTCLGSAARTRCVRWNSSRRKSCLASDRSRSRRKLMNERLFPEEELREMEKRTVDRLKEAIDAGEPERAKRIAERMYNEFVSMHDLYRDWTTAMLSAIGRRFGDEVLEEIMTEGVRAWWLPTLEKLPQGPQTLRHRVKMFVAGLRGHLQPLRIQEDDEKVVIQMRPCGSGGRLVLEGKYEGPDGFLKIRKPQTM